MNVLIIGGTRFVGYELTWRLIAAGHRVTLFNRGTLPDPFGARVERLRGDRTNEAFRRALSGRRFDAVADFAAYYGRDVRGVVDVLGDGVGHYVFISTGQVYLVRQGCPWPAREADYDGPLLPEPSDPGDQREWDYGMGKRECEDLLAEAWTRSRFPATRLRIPMVNGERDHNRRVESYLWRILDGGPLILPDGGGRPMRHVYSGAVVRAIVGLLGRQASFGQAFNLSQDEMPTLEELLALLCALVGAPARLVPIPVLDLVAAGLEPKGVSPFSGRWMSCLDPSRAVAELGFGHEPLRSYLDKIVTSFLAHPPAEPPASYVQRPLELKLALTSGARS